jgi:hypothetical protein
MRRFILIGITSRMLFGVLDGLIQGNPVVVHLNEFLLPIARRSINVPVGIIIDLMYGIILAGLFLLLYWSLPG